MASATPRFSRSLRRLAAGAAGLAVVAASQVALADEGGVSFWLPGQFGSLAAAPLTPGLTVTEIYYHANVAGGGDVGASRAITIGQFAPTSRSSSTSNRPQVFALGQDRQNST
jgi:hypothetical protein